MATGPHRKTAWTSAVLAGLVLCAAAGAQDWKAHFVPLFASASHPPGHQGFVRVVNRSDESGEVLIDATDDTGVSFGPVTLAVGAREATHFSSGDLEDGNPDKGLVGRIGAGTGAWRLRLRSTLDLEVLAYNHTSDGMLAAMHDLVPRAVVRRPRTNQEVMGHRVVIFNPASTVGQESRLRIVNRGEQAATVTIEGIDDEGSSPGPGVELSLPAGSSRVLTSQALESGEGEGLAGMLGDGQGKWQLAVSADAPVEVMNLVTSPAGHLANLSTAPGAGGAGVHEVPLFAAAINPHAHQGFVRIINRSDISGEVSIEAFDDAGDARGPVTLALGAGETVQFDSGDLELGNSDKGIEDGIGAGTGDWWLRLHSDLDLEVLALNRTHDGLLTTMHDVVPYTRVVRPGAQDEDEGHYVAIFNPGSDASSASRLRVVNPGAEAAAVRIEGIDDSGASPGPGVELVVPPRGSHTLTARELESGRWAADRDASGSLGDGRGKWRLVVTSQSDIRVMSLLASPAGHLVNLSTAARAGEAVPPPTAAGEHAAMEVTGRTTASTGTSMELRVRNAGVGEASIDGYEWVFSDGRRMHGPEVSVSFPAAGVYTAEVRAMSGTDVVASTEGAVAVFDAASGVSPGFAGIPALFGDVDQDGRVGPEDLALLREVLDGERARSSAMEETGDLDLSGVLDERDAALLAQALADGTLLPSALLDESARPGGVVAVVSPSLLDPDTDVRVYVDSVASPQVMRAILGYATFVVPASLTGEDAEVEVVVEVDGVVTERLELHLVPAVAPTVDAREDVLAFFEELLQLLADNEEAGRRFIEQLEALSSDDISSDDVAVVFGATTAAARELRAAMTELEAVLSGEGGAELAALLQTQLHANGLAEFRERLAASDAAPAPSADSGAERSDIAESTSLDLVCDVYLPAICFLKTAVDLVDDAATLVIAGCTVGGVASLLFPPAALAVASVCFKAGKALTVAQIAGTIIDDFTDPDLRLTSDKTALEAGETATIRAWVVFSGTAGWCGATEAGSTELLGRVIAAMLMKVTRTLLKRSDLLKKVVDHLDSKQFKDPEGYLTGILATTGQVLSNVDINGAFARVVRSICDLAESGRRLLGAEFGLSLQADAGRFNLRVSAGGILTRKEDDSREYALACPAGFPGTLTVCGSKEICGEGKDGAVEVSCGPGPVVPCCPWSSPIGEAGHEYLGSAEVNFPDAGLQEAVKIALHTPPGEPIYLRQIMALQHLVLSGHRMTNLAGLECATNLEFLDLSSTEILQASLSGMPNLRSLRLDNSEISELSLSGLPALFGGSLNFDNSKISKLSLSDLPALFRGWLDFGNGQLSEISLSDLPKLESLYLSSNSISKLSVTGLPDLWSLSLDSSRLSELSLSDLPTLGGLYFPNGRISGRISEVSLSELPAFNSVDLSDNQISKVSLSELPALEWLDLSDNRISDVSSLSDLTALEELDLSNNRISDISPLSGLTALKRLSLHDNRISDISPLSGLTALEWLNLSNNPISELSLSGLTALEWLYLSNNPISELSLSGLTALEWLNLSNNPISELSLSGLTALKSLDLSDNPISELSLSGLTALKSLDLSDNPISKVSLSGLTALKSLDLSGKRISELSLFGLTALESLDLSDNPISELSLSGLTALKSLGLVDNRISDLSPLSDLTALESLYLSNSRISDLSSLSDLTALESLYLSNNRISDLSPLSDLTALERLYLPNNRISDISPLSGLTALEELNLSDNRISDISPLSGLTALEWLNLSNNRISSIRPLLSYAGLDSGDILLLYGLPFSCSSSEVVATLRHGWGWWVAVMMDPIYEPFPEGVPPWEEYGCY